MDNYVVKSTKLRSGNIVAEHFLPEKKSLGTIILLDGMPSIPSRPSTINFLLSGGYSVLFIRYGGTWESKGVFLNTNPASEIVENIQNFLSQIQEKPPLTSQDIIFIGSSFGGLVALNIASKIEIKCLILLSPVISFSQVRNIDTLAEYLEKFYPGAYRFEKNKWNELIEDKILLASPPLSKTTAQNTLIIMGEDDNQIDPRDLENYCLSQNVSFKKMSGIGHVSLGNLSDQVQINIKQWLENRRTV